MKKIIRNSLFITSCLLGLISCSGDDDFIGPELVVADPNTFQLVSPLTAPSDTVDFINGNTYFQTSFNDKASWTLTLTGNTSGANKTFIGTSEYIDSTLVTWDGGFSTDGALKIFQEETVTASLNVFGIDEPFTYQLDIVNPLAPLHVLEGFNLTELPPLFYISGDAQDANEMPLEDGKSDVFDASFISDNSNAPEGSGYVLLEGQDLSFTKEYFVGNFGINAVARLFPKAALKTLIAQPESELYFNFFLKGSGTESTTKLEIQIEERDGDKWVTEVNTKFDGWKLISIPYEEMIINWGTSETQTHDNLELSGVGFLVSSVPSRNTVEISLDYPTFTLDKPLYEIK